MFIILSYDVEVKRNRRVRKICRKYLRRVQNSVFQGYITEGGLARLKRELQQQISPEEDSILIYRFRNADGILREEIGIIADAPTPGTIL